MSVSAAAPLIINDRVVGDRVVGVFVHRESGRCMDALLDLWVILMRQKYLNGSESGLVEE